MLYGTANDYPRVAYYDGEVYQYIFNGIPDAFNRVVLPFQPLEQKTANKKRFNGLRPYSPRAAQEPKQKKLMFHTKRRSN